MPRRLDLSGRDVALFAVLTALPLLGYQFGMGNQVEQFPIIERFRDPNFLVGDFYTDDGELLDLVPYAELIAEQRQCSEHRKERDVPPAKVQSSRHPRFLLN